MVSQFQSIETLQEPVVMPFMLLMLLMALLEVEDGEEGPMSMARRFLFFAIGF